MVFPRHGATVGRVAPGRGVRLWRGQLGDSAMRAGPDPAIGPTEGWGPGAGHLSWLHLPPCTCEPPLIKVNLFVTTTVTSPNSTRCGNACEISSVGDIIRYFDRRQNMPGHKCFVAKCRLIGILGPDKRSDKEFQELVSGWICVSKHNKR